MKDLRRVCCREDWMSEEEGVWMEELLAGLERVFRGRKIKDSPFLSVRVNDLAVSFLLVRRAERALWEERPEEEGRLASTPSATLDVIGKARERLRKSVCELEEYCDKMGQAAPVGIADRIKPIMVRARAVLKEQGEGDGEEKAA